MVTDQYPHVKELSLDTNTDPSSWRRYAAAVRLKVKPVQQLWEQDPHDTHTHTPAEDFMALESAIHLNKRCGTEEAHCEPPVKRITLPRASQPAQHISVRPN